MKTNSQEDLKDMRLSDRVLFALELALDQKDVPMAEILANALELAMTRKAGGSGFVERRDYPENVARAFQSLRDLKG